MNLKKKLLLTTIGLTSVAAITAPIAGTIGSSKQVSQAANNVNTHVAQVTNQSKEAKSQKTEYVFKDPLFFDVNEPNVFPRHYPIEKVRSIAWENRHRLFKNLPQGFRPKNIEVTLGTINAYEGFAHYQVRINRFLGSDGKIYSGTLENPPINFILHGFKQEGLANGDIKTWIKPSITFSKTSNFKPSQWEAHREEIKQEIIKNNFAFNLPEGVVLTTNDIGLDLASPYDNVIDDVNGELKLRVTIINNKAFNQFGEIGEAAANVTITNLLRSPYKVYKSEEMWLESGVKNIHASQYSLRSLRRHLYENRTKILENTTERFYPESIYIDEKSIEVDDINGLIKVKIKVSDYYNRARNEVRTLLDPGMTVVVYGFKSTDLSKTSTFVHGTLEFRQTPWFSSDLLTNNRDVAVREMIEQGVVYNANPDALKPTNEDIAIQYPYNVDIENGTVESAVHVYSPVCVVEGKPKTKSFNVKFTNLRVPNEEITMPEVPAMWAPSPQNRYGPTMPNYDAQALDFRADHLTAQEFVNRIDAQFLFDHKELILEGRVDAITDPSDFYSIKAVVSGPTSIDIGYKIKKGKWYTDHNTIENQYDRVANITTINGFLDPSEPTPGLPIDQKVTSWKIQDESIIDINNEEFAWSGFNGLTAGGVDENKIKDWVIAKKDSLFNEVADLSRQNISISDLNINSASKTVSVVIGINRGYDYDVLPSKIDLKPINITFTGFSATAATKSYKVEYKIKTNRPYLTSSQYRLDQARELIFNNINSLFYNVPQGLSINDISIQRLPYTVYDRETKSEVNAEGYDGLAGYYVQLNKYVDESGKVVNNKLEKGVIVNIHGFTSTDESKKSTWVEKDITFRKQASFKPSEWYDNQDAIKQEIIDQGIIHNILPGTTLAQWEIGFTNWPTNMIHNDNEGWVQLDLVIEKRVASRLGKPVSYSSSIIIRNLKSNYQVPVAPAIPDPEVLPPEVGNTNIPTEVKSYISANDLGLSQMTAKDALSKIDAQYIINNKAKFFTGELKALDNANEILNLSKVEASKTSIKLSFSLASGAWYDYNGLGSGNKACSITIEGFKTPSTPQPEKPQEDVKFETSIKPTISARTLGLHGRTIDEVINGNIIDNNFIFKNISKILTGSYNINNPDVISEIKVIKIGAKLRVQFKLAPGTCYNEKGVPIGSTKRLVFYITSFKGQY